MKNPTETASPARVLSASGAFIEALARATERPNIEAQQQLLLLALYGAPSGISQQDLPKYTGVQKSSNSRNIARLGDGERPLIERGPGWVESFEDPADRRNKLVRLTPRGRALLERVAEEVAPYFTPRQ